MTQKEKRIKIAEACGWRMVEGILAFPPLEWVKARIPADVFESLGCVDYTQIPDYFNDLNACHEMEKRLRTPQGDECDRIAEDRMVDYAERLNYAIDATSVQRSEAFGQTMRLWKEGE